VPLSTLEVYTRKRLRRQRKTNMKIRKANRQGWQKGHRPKIQHTKERGNNILQGILHVFETSKVSLYLQSGAKKPLSTANLHNHLPKRACNVDKLPTNNPPKWLGDQTFFQLTRWNFDSSSKPPHKKSFHNFSNQ